MAQFPFLKKLSFPAFSLRLFSPRPGRIVGIDVGIHSAKVVQLRYERERAILETYGELASEGYLKSGEAQGSGFLRYLDANIASLLKDILRESGVSARDAVFAVPAASSFVVTISLPFLSEREIAEAIQFEARKYVPTPLSEVVLDWVVSERPEADEERQALEVLLVAVPREVVEKFKRVGALVGIRVSALEVESFSLVRSLIGEDVTPTAIMNMGANSTTLAIVERGRLRISHTFSRGSHEWTRALERGLTVSRERAEAIKREVGMSERIEEREITSIIAPLIETLFAEVERIISFYNRRAARRIQKIILTGGGANLKGMVDFVSNKFGVEVIRGNPFLRVVTPAFMQPILREIGPSFAVAVGLALHGIARR